jgi:PleD family two-component response regulator
MSGRGERERANSRKIRPFVEDVVQMSRSTKILVIGDDTRSFLTIVRSLGRAGQIVHVAPSNFRS